LLTSANAVPKKLCEAGYAFKHANLDEALRAALRDGRGSG
jgi:NAD dependent epimerase/dehydratase family enzyme